MALRRPSRTQGYTLLELLVVIAILGLIIAFAAPRVIGYFQRSKTKGADIQISSLMAALDLYRLDIGHYPSDAQGLPALLNPPTGAINWNGPYLTRDDGIVDPWGRNYLYDLPSNGRPVVSSLGADGKPGGTGEDQDVTSKH